jgi:hypothetical protein
MINIIQAPDNISIDAVTWWMIYNSETLTVTVSPILSEGLTSSPLTMVTAPTEQELLDYISDNGLVSLE